MKKIFLTLSILLFPFTAFAGSQTYSTPGTHTFTVPNYTGTLVVEVWGGGGRGGTEGAISGGAGGQSSWNGTVIANGGAGGASSMSTCATAGGTASGGTTNTTGGAANCPTGGTSPNGGVGGTAGPTGGSPGTAPGGGGGGATSFYAGGGAGGYSTKTYSAGQLPVGSSITIVIGAGGSVVGPYAGAGASGRVTITWTDAAPPSSPPACNATTNPTTQTTGTSGSQLFSTVGNASFTVPQYDGTMKVEVWGGGGGASGAPYFHNIAPGAQGQQSTAYGLKAGGGWGGTNASHQGPWWIIYVPASGGPGGTASGGQTNLTGGAGGQGYGGASPFGGAGGVATSTAGKAPGGGAGGTWYEIGGGGGGAYSASTFSPQELSPGTSIPLSVGAGGGGSSAGANGAVKFTWTATGQTLSLCSAGYELKNGTCVSTAVCATCPAGQTLKTTPGNRIPATIGGGASGSQTYSTPGTHTFTVPANYQSLTVTVNGAGGGAAGVNAAGTSGGAGGNSSFGGSVIGYGGKAGGEANFPVTGSSRGADGIASGGNVSNTTGGGAVGGIGPNSYGNGGTGGQAVSSYAPGLASTIPVVVGAGGGAGTSNATAGSNGSVTITWIGGSTLSCPSGYALQGSECVAPDTTQCVPDTTCSAGFHWDATQNQCVLDTPVVDVIFVAAGTSWGFASLLHWDAVDANTCTGTGFDTNGATSGTITTDPLLQTTTFTLTCDTGTKAATVVIDSCPAGYTGTPPVCTLTSGTCPAGTTGTPPNCSAITSCPIGTTGTPPNCVCTPTNICSGNNVVNSCTGELVQACVAPSICSGGSCIMPAPSVISWQVAPLLVPSGNTTHVSWEVRNVSSCSVSGTNGDSWTGLTGAEVSGPINTQTVFTLHCIALAGSGAANVTRSATVNIVPVFQEK